MPPKTIQPCLPVKYSPQQNRCSYLLCRIFFPSFNLTFNLNPTYWFQVTLYKRLPIAPWFGTRGSLNFALSISPYTATVCKIIFSILLYSYTHGTRQVIQPLHPSSTNSRNDRLDRPLPLLATGAPNEGTEPDIP